MKNGSIKVKVIALIVLSLLLVGAVSTYFAVKESKDALVSTSMNNLTTARDIKASQIQKYFKSKIANITLSAKSAHVNDLAQNLLSIKQSYGVGADAAFPTDNSEVIDAASVYDAQLKEYMDTYGYYDIFIISKEGHVMYSVTKESDFGANLSSGSLSQSGLAEVWKNALQNNRVTFADMAPYAPSDGKPSMFVAKSFTVDSQEVVLAFQMSNKTISEIMQFREGYGDTQEDYLVGSDNLMRSDSFLSPQTHSVQNSFANPTQGSVKTDATKEAFNAKEDVQLIKDYNGNPVFSAYSQLNINEDFSWAIISEIDEAEVMAVPNRLRNKIVISVVVVLILIVLVALYLINTGLIKPIEKMKESLLAISKEHDLRIKLDSDAPKEIQEIAVGFNKLLLSLNDLISNTKQSSNENASISHELSTTATQVGNNVEKSVTVIDEASNKANSIKDNIVDSIKVA
ncbi:MAG: methyl-accepting chemotaxis protein, partial [Campylobacterota bacterium]